VTDTIALGSEPLGVTVDPSTNTVYVGVSGGVDVIDGATNAVTGSIADANDPDGLAVDPTTGTLYIANNSNGTLWVVQESTDAVLAKVSLGSGNEATGVTVDPSTDTVYVAIGNNDLVYVVNGATDVVKTTVTVGTSPFGIGADPTTGTVYVASAAGTVSAITESTNTVEATVTVGGSPYGLAVDPSTHAVFVAGSFDNDVTVVDASTSPPTVETTVSIGSAFDPLAVTDDPDTDAAYAANSVAKGATNPYAPGTPVFAISPPLGSVKLTPPTSGEPGYPTCTVPGNVTNKCSLGVKVKLGSAYANTEIAVTECNVNVTAGDPNACSATTGSKPGDEVLIETNSKGTAKLKDYPVLVSSKRAVGNGSCAAGDTCIIKAVVESSQTLIGTLQAFTAG